ncbi:MAG: alpha/beta hydrolase [Chloroflexi bacterium]|nr:alpha/beta hydrolase [Chloroflexota bacterium]
MTGSSDPDEQTQASPVAQSQSIRLPYAPGVLQFGELHLPGPGGIHPTVILIHGGFWRTPYDYTLMTGLAKDLAKRGIAAWNIEYRRIGDPQGGWPATLLDVARAADHLRIIAAKYALDLQRVVTVGHSAGGHLALWLAARPRITTGSTLSGAGAPGSPAGESALPLAISGAISLAGVSDLAMGWSMKLGDEAVAELLGGSPGDVPERYATASPAAMLPLGVPQVLIHGTADDRVPFAMSQAYAAAAQAAGDQATLIELKNQDHFVLIDPHSAAWTITVNALQQLLAI